MLNVLMDLVMMQSARLGAPTAQHLRRIHEAAIHRAHNVGGITLPSNGGAAQPRPAGQGGLCSFAETGKSPNFDGAIKLA